MPRKAALRSYNNSVNAIKSYEEVIDFIAAGTTLRRSLHSIPPIVFKDASRNWLNGLRMQDSQLKSNLSSKITSSSNTL